MRIMIAGKREAFRKALSGLLQTRAEYLVTAQASDRQALFAQLPEARPDLLLLDDDLTDDLIEKVIKPLKALDATPLFLVICTRASARQDYLDAGAAASVTKTEPPKSLLTAIEMIRLRGNDVQRTDRPPQT